MRQVHLLGNIAALAGVAAVAIGTPVAAGSVAAGNGTPAAQTFVTTVDLAIGDLFVVATKGGSSNPANTGDVDGETLTVGNLVSDGTNRIRLFWVRCASAHASGVTVTINYTNTNATKIMYAAKVSGTNATPLDIQSAAGASGTSTAPTITTGTLAQANEIVFAPLFFADNNAVITPDEFTAIGAGLASGGTKLILSYLITSATTAVTYDPTMDLSILWMTTYAAFKGA